MTIALLSGLIILVLLLIQLIAGVPIAVALGISSIAAILPIMPWDATVITAAQRVFPEYRFSPCLRFHSSSWQETL